MKVPDVQAAIAKIKYKHGSTIELAPIEGRLLDPLAGVLKLIIRLSVILPDHPHSPIIQTHKIGLPAAQHIRDEKHLLSLVRGAFLEAESYDTDQWFQYDGQFPYRGIKK